MLLIKRASISDAKETIDFFNQHLEKNESIYSDEFLCPFGVRGAINRNQIILAIHNNKVVGALRFYKRKREDITSLYQFAIGKKHRGRQLIKQMLKTIDTEKVVSLCPKNIDFNAYYEKTGWCLEKSNEEYNYWVLKREDL